MSITIDGVKIPDLPINGTHFQNLAVLTPVDLVLRAHLMIEQLLDYLIQKVSGNEELITGVGLSFHQKAILAKNLRLRIELFSFIKRLNKLRNKFAHNLDYELGEDDIRELESLHNCCFSSIKTNILDASLMVGKIKIVFNGEEIHRELSIQYKEADKSQKLMMILSMFIGNKLLDYIKLVYKDSLEMDKRSTNRINTFKTRQLSYQAGT